MTKKIKENTLAGFRPDPRPGRFGSVDTGKVPRGKSRGDYSGGAGKMQTAASTFPYIELEFDVESEGDAEDVKKSIEDMFADNPKLVDKIQSRIGGMKFKNDPGSKSRSTSRTSGNNRTFQGGIAEALPGIMGKSKKSGSTNMAPFPSSVLYPKKNRGPALGGVSMSPASYRTGPGKIRVRDPGSLQGNSKAPKVDFDDGERAYHLGDFVDPDRRVVLRVRKMVRDILSADNKE